MQAFADDRVHCQHVGRDEVVELFVGHNAMNGLKRRILGAVLSSVKADDLCRRLFMVPAFG